MMRKSCLIILFIVGFYSLGFSQIIDTVYYDRNWKPCVKKHSKYYRVRQKESNGYKIQDYYKNGALQMEGSATSINPDILHGPVRFYNPNGTISALGFYENDKQIGIWSYVGANGQVISRYNYSPQSKSDSDRNLLNLTREVRKNYKTAMSENDKRFSMIVRGKVAGFVIIEDEYFSTATIGTELLFRGRHSLGIDYTYFGWQSEHDDSQDQALTETYERRGYMYFDYKCKVFAYHFFDIYFNLYDKVGTYHQWHEGVAAGYSFWEKPYLNNTIDGTFNEVGAGLGIKCYLTDRFYIDASANGGKLFSNNNTVTYDSLFVADRQYHVKTDKNNFYIRVNFGYKLFVKKKKD